LEARAVGVGVSNIWGRQLRLLNTRKDVIIIIIFFFFLFIFHCRIEQRASLDY
jgi:hypothetical protein